MAQIHTAAQMLFPLQRIFAFLKSHNTQLTVIEQQNIYCTNTKPKLIRFLQNSVSHFRVQIWYAVSVNLLHIQTNTARCQ